MLWVNDNNKMSVYHLKYVTKPKKPWNEFQRGDSSRKLTNNLAVKQIMQVHKKGKIVRFMYKAQFITCIQFYVCGWTSITHQKVTSAELGGLTHFMRSKLYTCVFPQKMDPGIF